MLTDAQTNKQQIENLQGQASGYASRIQELSKSSEATSSSIQNILTEVTALKEQINGIKRRAEEKTTIIDQKYQDILAKLEEMQKAYTSFREIKAKIDDPDGGLETALALSNKLMNDIAKARTGAEDSYKQSKTLEENILEMKNLSKKGIIEIENNKKKSEEYKNQIGEILDIATNTSVGDSFNQRKKEIENKLKYWLIGSVVSTILLTLAIGTLVWLAHDNNGLQIDQWKFWYRFFLTSPLIYAVYFFSTNYTRERELLERYAYKFSLSLSLRSYILLLTDNFKSSEALKGAQNFILNTLAIVYKEPYMEKNRKYAFGINRIINLGFEESEVQELREKIATSIEDKLRKEPNK